MPRSSAKCTTEDLGYQAGDPYTETVPQVNSSDATDQIGNIGLAKAKNADLTEWEFLPPILSANCVTERPQIYQSTTCSLSAIVLGITGSEGVYGFVGNGIRSDYQQINQGFGLVLGNPSNLNYWPETPFDSDYNQPAGHFQSYSHYVMPAGLIQSFIDTIGVKENFRRGGFWRQR